MTLALPAATPLGQMPRRADSPPYVFTTTSTGRCFSKTSHYYYWNQVRPAAGRRGMDFYEVRHFAPRNCSGAASPMRMWPFSWATPTAARLFMSTYRHSADDEARERVRAAFSVQPGRLRAV